MDKKRVIYFDYIKAIACILVVLQHVAAYGYLYTKNNIWNDYWICNYPDNCKNYVFNVIIIAIAKAAVSLFIMVNGALMLQKDIEYKNIFRKYILRCIKIILFWNILMALCTYADGGTLNDVLSVLVFGYQQFWFLYALIGLYLVQPLLRAIVKQENLLKVVVWIFITTVLLNSLENFLPEKLSEVISHLSSEIGISDFPKLCGYYCLGYYLYKREKKFKVWEIIVGSISVILSIVYAIYNSSKIYLFVLDSIEIFTVSALVVSIVIFCFIKKNETKKSYKVIKIINENSFFIYVVHVLLIEIALHFHVSLDLFNVYGLGILLGTASIMLILIVLKTLVINRLKFLKGFCEW